MTDHDPVLRLRPVDWRTIEGETIVLDMETERYLGVNRAGTLMWERLASGTTQSALVAALSDAFDIDEERAAADVDAFVAQVRAAGLLASSET